MVYIHDQKRHEHPRVAATAGKTSDAVESVDLSEQCFSSDQIFSIEQDLIPGDDVVIHLDEPMVVELQSEDLLTERGFIGTCVSYMKACLTKENILIAANLAGQAAAVGSFIGLILAA